MNVLKKIGVLLINLGTPTAPTPTAIKKYLAEFLHDRQVVDLSPILWYPLLHGIILPKRSKKIAQNYTRIWTVQGSPLLAYSQSLCDKIQEELPDMQVELAMTYGYPSIDDTLDKLKDCAEVIVIPLFPQYSTTTTLASKNKVNRIIKQYEQFPPLNFIDDYADHADYIDALFYQIMDMIEKNGVPDTLLFSYHGIPVSYIQKRNDCYVKRCELTTQLVKDKFDREGINIDIQLSYQSRFGKGQWTLPNTSDLLQQLPKQGKLNIQIICPGFAVDCLETLDEIAYENKKIFIESGGKEFHYVPALNDSMRQVNLLISLIKDQKKAD